MENKIEVAKMLIKFFNMQTGTGYRVGKEKNIETVSNALDRFGGDIASLKNHIRVNTTLKTVEIYDDYGVKTVLRDLTEEQYQDYLKNFRSY